ncbi:MAG: HigA family addiction module antidote protein [Magnetococcales bacterium]|nr:HigA family addiction module antidote protein [Magnetococcales bacterium]
MTISIEDIHHLDITDIATGEPVPPAHPGEFLKEMVDELKIRHYLLAKSLGVSAMRISHILHGRRPVTAEMALRLGLFFNQSPEYWLGLQTHYDMDVARRKVLDRLRKEIIPLHAA